jgi:hypothetical protein
MKYNKQWKSWSEFLKSHSQLCDSDGLECKEARQFKHCTVNMTHYYSSNWSGWHDYLKKAKK